MSYFDEAKKLFDQIKGEDKNQNPYEHPEFAAINGDVPDWDKDTDNDIGQMFICEAAGVLLRPNQLYRFVVDPSCEKCLGYFEGHTKAQIADYARGGLGL